MDGLTRVDYPDGNYVSYSYDNACRLTKVTTPFGSTSYEYDLLDRLTRVVDRMVMQPFMSMMQTETAPLFIMPMVLLPHMNMTCSTDLFVKKLLTTRIML